MKRFEALSELVADTPIAFFYNTDVKFIETNIVAKQCESLIRATIERTPQQDDPAAYENEWISFMGPPLEELEVYLERHVFPEINKFKRALLGFKFKSPLNFIMLGNDFHEFFGMFYHAKLLTQYLTNFMTDSVFSLHSLHEASRQAGDSVKKHDYEVKQAAALAMRNSLQ